MNIPDSAVRSLAYHRAQRDHDKRSRLHSAEQWPYWEQVDQDTRDWYAKSYMDEAREDLEVAAPHIARQAWDEGYEEGEADGNSSSAPAGRNPYK